MTSSGIMRAVGTNNLPSLFILLLAFASCSSKHRVNGQLAGSYHRYQMELKSKRAQTPILEEEAYWARHLQDAGSTSTSWTTIPTLTRSSLPTPLVPTPTSTQPPLPSPPVPTPTLTQPPSPTLPEPPPALTQPSSPTPVPTPTLTQPPSPTPLVPTPTSTQPPLPSPPVPTLTLTQPPSPTLPEQPSSPTPTPGSNSVTVGCCPVVRRAPGATALEYLGTGYNIFEGNPRGSLTSELDPGFRNGVIKLIQDQNMLTLNREFAVPIGTEFRYSTSCQFSSTSEEVSTTTQYQKQLSKEAITTETESAFSFGFLKFGQDKFFSKSEKSQSFSMDRAQTQTTTFQSRALCTEFEARLHRFHNHEVQDAFLRAVNILPNSFQRQDQTQIAIFEDFLKEYGTHYVNYVVLGAKQIYSLEMKSMDVMSLRQMRIDVATSTSSKNMFGYQGKVDVEASGKQGPIGLSASTTLEIKVGDFKENTQTDSNSTETNNLDMIATKTERVVETNVGGIPPADGKWQTWAATARDRPMPIVYELTEIGEAIMMARDADGMQVAKAYTDYIEFYLESGGTAGGNILDALHYGVAQPKGLPISSYTLDPTSNLRTLTQFMPRIPSQDPAINNEEDFHRYDFLWDGSKVVESAVFLTLIRDNLSPNTKEDAEEDNAFFAGDLEEIQLPFGLKIEPGRATAAILNVNDTKKLNSFTYLAADNLPGSLTYKAGVVHPQGYPTNRIFGPDIGFKISQRGDTEFDVTFTRAFNETPTFLAFPLWFPKDDVYPKTLGEVALATRSCNTTVCYLQVGSPVDQGEDESLYLGFSFIAFDGALKRETGLVHGNVGTLVGPGMDKKFVFNLTDESDFGDKNYKVSKKLGASNLPIAVLIEFQQEFLDIPSVTATPLIGDFQSISGLIPTPLKQGFEISDFFLPSVYIEHITTQQVLIRSRVSFRDPGTAEFIPFSFVAVGPVGNEPADVS